MARLMLLTAAMPSTSLPRTPARSVNAILFLLVLVCLVPRADAGSEVVLWGYYFRDTGGPAFYPVPDVIAEDLSDVVEIAAGAGQDMALRRNRTVVVWGDNAYGQRQVPFGLNDVVAIASGAWHTIALKADGTVVQWGCDIYGQALMPSDLTSVAAISAGFFENLALRMDGTVTAWGPVGTPPVPPGLSNVVAIATQNKNALAVKADGRVMGWNAGYNGAPWNPLPVPPEADDVIAVAVGSSHYLALKADGTVVGWGGGEWGEGIVPEGLTNVVAIAAGDGHSLALQGDGKIIAWGAGTVVEPTNPPQFGQSIVPEGLTNVVDIDAGGFHSLALVGDGPPFITRAMVDRTVVYGTSPNLYVKVTGQPPLHYQWRHNGQALPGATNAVLALPEAGFEQAGQYSVAISNASGTVVSRDMRLSISPLFITRDPESRVVVPGWDAVFDVSSDSALPVSYQWQRDGVDIEGATNSALVLVNVQAEDAGRYGVMVANSAGSVRSRDATLSFTHVVAWGSNSMGQTNVPPGLTNVAAVAAGGSHSLALKRDGSVVGWGLDNAGQASVPSELSDVIAVSAGVHFSVALRSDGTVVGWGDNFYGQCQPPPGLTDVVQIAAGGFHGLALRADGTVVAWGSNSLGQTDVPPGLSGVARIAAGSSFSMALKLDGTVVIWGALSVSIPLEPPAALTNIVAIAAGASHYLVLRADGGVASGGMDRQTPLIATELTNVVAVAAGGYQNAAFRADGTLRWWGTDPRSTSLAEPPAGMEICAVAASSFRGSSHGLAQIAHGPPLVTSPSIHGSVVAGDAAYFHVTAAGARPVYYQWRFNGEDLTGETNAMLVVPQVESGMTGSYSVVVSNAFGVVEGVACDLGVVPLRITAQPSSQSTFRGSTVSLAVSAVGPEPLAYQWFYNGSALPEATDRLLVLAGIQLEEAGQYAVEVSNALGAVRSAEATVAVGCVAAWGQNQQGQTDLPVGLTNVVAVAGGGNFSLALNRNGSVVVWGDASPFEIEVLENLADVISISAGAQHALALRTDGRVTGWGANSWGEAELAKGLSNVIAISAGSHHSLALLADGTVVAAGYNEYGQIDLPWWDLFDTVAIAAGSYHNLALKADGSVVAWGDSHGGATDVPQDLTNAVAIAAGFEFSMALTDTGTVISWGGNDRAGVTAPPGLYGVVAIAADGLHSLALKSDGTVVEWGLSCPDGCSSPSGVMNAAAVAAGFYHSLALLGDGPPPTGCLAVDPVLAQGRFSLSLDSQSGRVYALEHTDQLMEPAWIRLPLVPGNGGRLTLVDDAAAESQRFYRARRW
jgi:alpha-tubulin suppressor-like RCC1 family protein